MLTEKTGTGTESGMTGIEKADTGIEKADTGTENMEIGTDVLEEELFSGLSDTEGKLVRLILKSPEITQDKMAEIMGMSKNGIRYAMNKLKNRGILVRVGAAKKGKWFIQQSSLGADQEEYVISE